MKKLCHLLIKYKWWALVCALNPLASQLASQLLSNVGITIPTIWISWFYSILTLIGLVVRDVLLVIRMIREERDLLK